MTRLENAKHIFSHVEWRMTGYLISLPQVPEGLPGDILFVEWRELKETYTIPSAFIKYKQYLERQYGG